MLPPCDLPEGLTAKYPLKGDGRCSACGRPVGGSELASALERLQAAAADECQACELLDSLEQQQQQQQHGEEQRQKEAFAHALGLLRRSLACRGELLHAHNLLLGQSHHHLASAAAMAAGVHLDDRAAAIARAGHATCSSDAVEFGGQLAGAIDQQCSIRGRSSLGTATAEARQGLLLDSISATRRSLAILTMHYGTNSTAVAFEGLRLGALLLEAAGTAPTGSSVAQEHSQQAQAVLCEALSTLTLHFGNETL